MAQYFTDFPEKKSAFLSLMADRAKIIITSHQNPDGDAFGSSLGLASVLKQLGHKVTVISPTDHAEFLNWLPDVENVLDFQNKEQVKSAESLINEADIIFCLDFSSLNRLKGMETIIRDSTAIKVLVDHHQEPEDFADYVFWDEGAAATSQLIYRMIEQLDWKNLITKETAICLYTGILTDTGSFRFDNTSKEVHQIAGELLEKGINPNRITRNLFDQNSLDRIKFLGYALGEKLTYLADYRTAYFVFSKEELEKFNSKSGDTEGIVNYGLSVAGTVMSVIFIERDDLIKISFRSIEDFSVADMARTHFNGGGHKNAAGGQSKDSLQKTVDRFLELLPLYEKNLLAQPTKTNL
jgi:phosphoesterase RecJ-like protein